MATPNFIGQEGCTILYSGPKPVFDAVAPALRALGGATTYVGADIGHANALDNALLVVLWGSLYGVLQGAAICQAESFPLEGFSASLRGFMPVIDESLMSAIQRIGQRRFGADETTPATVETCRASVAYILQMSRERGIDPGLPQALDGLFQRAMDAGRAGDDFASVYQGMR
jgi:3-hydroxyisobutyrate dehydrogenase-like beta-hydroxyacid dehydrogenase